MSEETVGMGQGWNERAEYQVIPPGHIEDATRWTAIACIPGFTPRDWKDYGSSAVEAMANLVAYIEANPPTRRTDLPTVDEMVGILKDSEPVPPDIPLDDDLRTCLLFALRYALGRRSYAPFVVAKVIGDNLSAFPVAELERMHREIHDAGDLGDRCDREMWRGLADAVGVEVERRRERA